ncbi:MAG: hypothetical protein ABSB65_14515 [Candidatus Acidiferrales bacterium]
MGNWNPAAVPNNSGTTTYDVKIGAANSNVTMDVLNDTIDNLTLTSNNSLTINAGDSLALVSGTSLNSGTTNVLGSLGNDLGDAFTNIGTFNNYGAFDNTGTIANRGTLNNTAGATFANDGTFTNYGRFNSAGIFLNGDFSGISSGTFMNDGTVENSGSMYLNYGTVTNNGTIIDKGGIETGLPLLNFSNNGIIIIIAGGFENTSAMSNGGTIYIKPGGFFDNASCSCGDGYLANSGKIIDAGGMSNGIVNEIDSPGILIVTATGQLSNAFVFNTNGLINNGTINNSASLTNEGTLTNSGTINNANDDLRNANLFTDTLVNTGTINEVLEGSDPFGSEVFAGTLINRGTINDSGMVFGDTFNNRGTLNITSAGVFNGPSTSSGGSFLQTAGQTIVNGTLNSVPAVQIQGGTLSGSGIINANVIMGGKISPGNSPGILTINGNYTQTASGVYDAEIAGLTPGPGYDELRISGTADLDGKLDVGFLDDFTVDLGDSFILMKYSSETGTYSMVELPKLGPGLKWDLSYDPGYLDLSVAPSTVNPTPEPSTYLLWGTAGLLGIGIWARRKFRRASEIVDTISTLHEI